MESSEPANEDTPMEVGRMEAAANGAVRVNWSPCEKITARIRIGGAVVEAERGSLLSPTNQVSNLKGVPFASFVRSGDKWNFVLGEDLARVRCKLFCFMAFAACFFIGDINKCGMVYGWVFVDGGLF